MKIKLDVGHYLSDPEGRVWEIIKVNEVGNEITYDLEAPHYSYGPGVTRGWHKIRNGKDGCTVANSAIENGKWHIFA